MQGSAEKELLCGRLMMVGEFLREWRSTAPSTAGMLSMPSCYETRRVDGGEGTETRGSERLPGNTGRLQLLQLSSCGRDEEPSSALRSSSLITNRIFAII